MTEFEKANAKVEKYTRKLAKAQFRVGNMYYNGEGVKQDYAEAVRWYKKAAEQGHPKSQYYLGDQYYYGQNVKQDLDEALHWYKKAAKQGDVDAQAWADVVTKIMENKL